MIFRTGVPVKSLAKAILTAILELLDPRESGASTFESEPVARFISILVFYLTLGIGLILSSLGLLSLFGVRLDVVDWLTVLTRPSGLGEIPDQVFWISLTVIGLLLVVSIQVQLVSILALVMILAKTAVVEGRPEFLALAAICGFVFLGFRYQRFKK